MSLKEIEVQDIGGRKLWMLVKLSTVLDWSFVHLGLQVLYRSWYNVTNEWYVVVA